MQAYSYLFVCLFVLILGSESFTIMGDTIQDIQCLGKVIVPEKVVYIGATQGSSCVNSKAWLRVADLCYKKSACTLTVDGMIDSQNPDYADPCPSEDKKLEVEYNCVRGWYNR